MGYNETKQKDTVIRRYAISLPVYDVRDVDTGEILSEGVPLKEAIRRHGDIMEHLEFIPAAERIYA